MATTTCTPYNEFVSWVVNYVKQRHGFVQNPLISLELNLRPKQDLYLEDGKKREKVLEQMKARMVKDNILVPHESKPKMFCWHPLFSAKDAKLSNPEHYEWVSDFFNTARYSGAIDRRMDDIVGHIEYRNLLDPEPQPAPQKSPLKSILKPVASSRKSRSSAKNNTTNEKPTPKKRGAIEESGPSTKRVQIDLTDDTSPNKSRRESPPSLEARLSQARANSRRFGTATDQDQRLHDEATLSRPSPTLKSSGPVTNPFQRVTDLTTQINECLKAQGSIMGILKDQGTQLGQLKLELEKKIKNNEKALREEIADVQEKQKSTASDMATLQEQMDAQEKLITQLQAEIEAKK